jgi:hypothetical protein
LLVWTVCSDLFSGKSLAMETGVALLSNINWIWLFLNIGKEYYSFQCYGQQWFFYDMLW